MADREPGSIAQRVDAGDAWRSSTVAESSLAGIVIDLPMSASAKRPITDCCGRPRSYRSGLGATALFWMEYRGPKECTREHSNAFSEGLMMPHARRIS